MNENNGSTSAGKGTRGGCELQAHNASYHSNWFTLAKRTTATNAASRLPLSFETCNSSMENKMKKVKVPPTDTLHA